MLRLGLSIVVFLLPMAMGLWVAKRSYQDDLFLRSESAATRSMQFFESLISYAEDANLNALPLLNGSCVQALPTLRELAAFQAFLRSVNLVKDGEIVCSSLVGPTEDHNTRVLNSRWVWLEQGSWVRPGVPILVVYAERGRDGVRTVIDAEAISFMLQFTDPLVDTQFHVGDNWLGANWVLTHVPPASPERTYYEAYSQRYPVSVYASVSDAAPWLAVWEARQRVLSVLLGVSMILAGGVYWFMGQPRSLYGELVRGLRTREFVPYLQPIIDWHSEHVVGAEVLMRWQHPSGELIRPDLFIPQAEASGLIGTMTVQLMEMVGEALERDLTRLPKGFYVSFNISAHHCKDDVLLYECRRFLNRFPLGAVRLSLELTERELFIDDAHSNTLFKQLDELGVRLAIDDFGTGHSNFSYLQRFHIHVLKIDKSFVSLIGKESLSGHIVENIIDLANRLELCVVAEGVETREQVEYLAARGVSMMQGYLYGKPEPLETFIESHAPSEKGRNGSAETAA